MLNHRVLPGRAYILLILFTFWLRSGLAMDFVKPDMDDSSALIAGRSNRPTMLNIDGLVAKRCEDVELNLAVLGDGPGAKPLREGDTIRLNLFKDADLTGRVLRQSTDINGVHGLTCSIVGTKYGRAYLSSRDGLLLANINLPEKQQNMMISYDRAAQTHKVFEIDSEKSVKLPGGHATIPDDENKNPTLQNEVIITDIADSSQTTPSIILSEPSPTATDEEMPDVIIDVMIVYTPAAESYASAHDSGMHNLLNLMIQKVNDTHANSETGVIVNLAHSTRVDYTEVEPYLDLDRVTYSKSFKSYYDQYYMEDVPLLRNTYKADFVCLLEVTSGVGGLGWGLREASGDPGYAYCLVRAQQASWTNTISHEWGHNMGAGHSKTQYIQQGPQVFSYSAGWQWTEWGSTGRLGYCSTMTYEEFDGNTLNGNEYEIIPYFSNPDVQYYWTKTGDPVHGNNALTIRSLRPVLTEYRHLNHAPVIVTNEEFSTMLGMAVPLTEYELFAEDPDAILGDTADKLTYTITTNVSHGSLFYDSNENNKIDDNEAIKAGDTFTQLDINNQMVRYLPTEYGPETDSFAFRLKDPDGAGPENQTMNISIMAFHIFFIDEVSVTEGDNGTTTATFTIDLAYDDGTVVTVDYATEDATAEDENGDGDYQSVSGTLTFSGSDLTKKVDVLINGDGIAEDDEYFLLRLDNAVNAIVVFNGMVTILNDDDCGITVSEISGDTSEGGEIATFTITLNSQPGADVVISATSSMPDEGAVSPMSMTFTPENWYVPQTFTVTGQNDYEIDGGRTYLITFTCVSDDDIYNNYDIESISLKNIDNDFTITATMCNQLTAFNVRHTGGTITPEGEIIIDGGEHLTFTMTPDPGDELDDVIVNGISQGPVESYTFENVTANGTIEAHFIENYRPGKPIISGDHLTTDSTPTFTWVSGGDGYGMYHCWLDDADEPDPNSGMVGETITYRTPLSDGLHTLHLCERQVTNYMIRNWSEVAHFEFIIDTVPPFPTFESSSGAYTTGPFTVTMIYNEIVSGFDWDSLNISNANISNQEIIDDLTYRFTATPVLEGEILISLSGDQVMDEVGQKNIPSDILKIIYDITVPSPPIFTGDSITSKTSPSWTWTSGEGGCGIYRRQLNDSQLHDDTTTTTEASYTPAEALEEGTHTLYVQECDEAGNWSAWGEFVVVVDTACVSVNAFARRSDFYVSLKIGGQIDPAGHMVVVGGGQQTFFITPDEGYEILDLFVNGVSQGACSSYVFENEGEAATIEAVIIPLNRPGKPILSGDLFTSDTTPTWRWSPADDGDSVFHVQFPNHGPEYSRFLTLDKYYDVRNPLPEGPHTLWVQGRNSAKNWSEWASCIITVDTTSPTLTLATDAGEWTSEPFAVRSIFNEPVRDFAPDEITVTNGMISNLATEDNITFTFTVTPLDSGEVTVQLPQDATRDRAGMPCEPSNIISTVFRDPDSAAGGHWILLE